MLFNSPEFLFGFLPATLLGFAVLTRSHWHRMAVWWAAAASLIFYAWDAGALVGLLLLSSAINYGIGLSLSRSPRRWVLASGVAFNLALLGYFKYAGLLTRTMAAAGVPVPVITVGLPIGISFYTFTQIAFLVDAYRSEAREYSPVNYTLFVTFFPHLIAGPILHHKEMMPQFDARDVFRASLGTFTVGLAWFTVGLFKKSALADNIAPYADQIFKAVEQGVPVSPLAAWSGALSYALQLYFDFSGYSDMAIGLAAMMGIAFPINFNSPYKAASLIDFWRRWHMTLSRFLRDYLYIPLGGNRRGPIRRNLNLVITMVLGGLWHGPSWNFAAWGAIHGLGLLVNHAWQDIARRTGIRIPRPAAQFLTLLVVVLAWVPFRAETFKSSVLLWTSMFGLNAGQPMPSMPAAWSWIVLLGAVALLLPNTSEIFDRVAAASRRGESLRWAPTPAWAVALGAAFGIAFASSMFQPSAFLYFRF